MVENMTFFHSGSMGDIIYSLPTILTLGGGNLYIKKESQYYTLRRLIERQPYISRVMQGHAGTSLDGYRIIERKAFEEDNGGKHLAQCHLEALKVNFDLTNPWLFNIDRKLIAPIVVGRSKRYHDKNEIDWSLLRDYKVAFVGFENEYERLEKIAGFSPLKYECKDALDMAEVISGSLLFLGNQSLAFAIAEAMKHPRVLEVYHKNSNCIPNGGDGYTYLDEELIGKYTVK